MDFIFSENSITWKFTVLENTRDDGLRVLYKVFDLVIANKYFKEINGETFGFDKFRYKKNFIAVALPLHCE